MNYLNMNI